MKNEHILKEVMVVTVLALMVLSNITIINAEKVENNIAFNDPVIDLQFYQMDFNFDDTIYENTDWGSVDLSFVGQEPIMVRKKKIFM